MKTVKEKNLMSDNTNIFKIISYHRIRDGSLIAKDQFKYSESKLGVKETKMQTRKVINDK